MKRTTDEVRELKSANLIQEEKPESLESCVQMIPAFRDEDFFLAHMSGTQTNMHVDEDAAAAAAAPTEESLDDGALLNEHFNNPPTRGNEHEVSRTEQADGGIGGTLGPVSQRTGEGASAAEHECPICTETYLSQGERSVALLNCDHTVCQLCLNTLLGQRSDCCTVPCPLCRQNTPLLRWQIRGLQEDTAFHTRSTGQQALAPQSDLGRGLCLDLEELLLWRVETGRVCGCFEHPSRLVQAIRGMRGRCRCCYMCSLVLMYVVELSFLLLVFLPVLVLVLLFTLAD